MDNKPNQSTKLKDLINKMVLSFYDQKLIFENTEEKNDLEDSLMKKLDEYSFM